MIKIVTVSGASCSGKTTLSNNLIQKFGYSEIISTTTRKIRKGEVNNKDYRFISKEDFSSELKKGSFIESTEFSSEYYGVLKNEILNKDDTTFITVVDPKGMESFKQFCDENDIVSFSIFINISLDEAIHRMKSRDEFSNTLNERIKNLTENEMNWKDYQYDLFIGEYSLQNSISIENSTGNLIDLKKEETILRGFLG